MPKKMKDEPKAVFWAPINCVAAPEKFQEVDVPTICSMSKDPVEAYILTAPIGVANALVEAIERTAAAAVIFKFILYLPQLDHYLFVKGFREPCLGEQELSHEFLSYLNQLVVASGIEMTLACVKKTDE